MDADLPNFDVFSSPVPASPGLQPSGGLESGTSAPSSQADSVQSQLSTRDLIQALHGELRTLAAARMRSERPDHTLSPTALVHEAYLRLDREGHAWQSRAQFFKAAAEAMRRILIESAEAKAAAKRGGGRLRVPLDVADNESESSAVVLNIEGDENFDPERLDAALQALKEESNDIYWIVMLRYFAGLTAEKTAEVLEITERTVHRRWSAAKLFLFDQCQTPRK